MVKCDQRIDQRNGLKESRAHSITEGHLFALTTEENRLLLSSFTLVKRMSVPSLLNLSIDAVVNGIFNGSLPSTNFKLDPDISNEIYRRINLESEKAEDLQFVHQILTRLHITRADLRDKKLWKENDSLILMNQSLDALILGDFITPEKLAAEAAVEIRPGPRHHVEFDIKGLMESMLNLESRKSLETLDIGGFEEEFEYDSEWVEEIFKNLPSLVNLNLFGRHLWNTDLDFLGENLKNLRILDISNTTLTSLEGINQLKNLETLAIGGLEFESSEDLMGIFELENLRVLDLTSRGDFNRTNILVQFLECDQILPNLKFVDCSGLRATNSMVQKLLQTHPTIQKIALCFTGNISYDLLSVEVLSTHSLISCVNSLKWYISLKNPLMAEQILKEIRRISAEDYDTQKEVDLRECLDVVCSTVDGFPRSKTLHRVVTECLVHLCSRKRILLFSPRQRLDLLNLLYNLLDLYPDWTVRGEYEETRLVGEIWKFFNNHDLLISSNFNLSKTVDYCLDSMAWAEPKHLNEKCITIMRDCVLLMRENQEESFFGDLELCERILYLLNRLHRLRKWKLYNMVLIVLERMAKKSPANFVAAGGIKTLIEHLKKYTTAKNLEILQGVSLDGEFYEEYRKELRTLVRLYLTCKRDWEKSDRKKMPTNLQLITSILLLNLGHADSESLYLQILNDHLKSMIQKHYPKFILKYYQEKDIVSFLTDSSFDARLLWGLKMLGRVYHLKFFKTSEILKARLMTMENQDDLEIREMAKTMREKIFGDAQLIA